MTQKKLSLILSAVSAAFAIIAIVLLIFGIIYDGDHVFTQVFMIICAVLCLALAGELVYVAWFSGGNETPNYFLYDSNTKKNVTVDKLTVQVISKRMDRYFSKYAPSAGRLWTDRILESPDIEIEDCFKPLVGYKLLYDLAVTDVDKGWKCIELASYETVDFVCQCLEMNGEEEVAGNIRKMKTIQPFQVKYIRDYLVSNCNYLQTKMLMYVRENIEQFQ